MARILVVDDELNLRHAVARLLRSNGHVVDDADSAERAVERCQAEQFDLLILDIALPDQSGVELLRRIRTRDATALAIFLTADTSLRTAVDAIHAGGYDYLTKPFDNDVLLLTVGRALERLNLVERVKTLEHDLALRTSVPGIVGQSPAIRDAVRLLMKAARTDADVIVSGETGTGKELAAMTIHRHSSRSAGPFVALNCGAIPSTLAESMLFGHERGAFTDAKTMRRGQFELAQSGTIFLDEVGELSAEVQAKLLRVLQQREVVRVGADMPIALDVRIVAATNKDLFEEVRQGRFREDLFWRLNVFQIQMPPLRDRLGDLPQLVDFLLVKVNAECRTEIGGVSPSVMQRFKGYRWPGNIRELTNVLRHASVICEGATIDMADLPPHLCAGAPTTAPASQLDDELPEWLHGTTLEEGLLATERRLVEAMLHRFEGKRAAAAAALGIDRRTLYQKIEDHGLRTVTAARVTKRR
jgi:DNA-binding NtrC family response regulator